MVISIKFTMVDVESFAIPLSGQTEFNGFPNPDFDECIHFESPTTEEPPISGQFCSVTLDRGIPYDLERQIETANDTLLSTANQKLHDLSKKMNMTYSGSVESLTPVSKFTLKELVTTREWLKSFGLSLPISICVPKACSPTDVEHVLNKIYYPVLRLPIELDRDCEFKDKKHQLKTHQIIAM